MARARVLGLLLLPGCVNDYVVRDDDGVASTGSSGAASDGNQDPDGSGGDGSDGGGSLGDGSGGGDSGSSGGTMGDVSGGPSFSCQSCSADAQCGDEFDSCVDLGAVGPRCVISCPEAGCGQGFDCSDVTSVDGVQLAQCVPLDPHC